MGEKKIFLGRDYDFGNSSLHRDLDRLEKD
jgi:hypothetical protein